jgi:S-adenosylmethionine decarboxylase
LDLKGCRVDLLDDLPFIRESLIEAAISTGATIVGQTFHKFAPQGVTGVVAIAESHVCIHTWPEYGYAAVDIFTCGDSFDPHAAAQFIIAKLHAQSHTLTELSRGVLDSLPDDEGQQIAGTGVRVAG